MGASPWTSPAALRAARHRRLEKNQARSCPVCQQTQPDDVVAA